MPPAKTPLNPASFPRPPLLERTPRRLQVKWRGRTVADTTDGYWVLETYHPPTYYLPPTSLLPPFSSLLTRSRARGTMCEWKGAATYWDLPFPSADESSSNSSPATSNPPPPTSSSSPSSVSEAVRNKIWSYESPTPGFTAIRGYLSFYAGSPWQCFVDGEEVEAQPGDFYGGWVTSEVQRDTMKGRPGTNWW